MGVEMTIEHVDYQTINSKMTNHYHKSIVSVLVSITSKQDSHFSSSTIHAYQLSGVDIFSLLPTSSVPTRILANQTANLYLHC